MTLRSRSFELRRWALALVCVLSLMLLGLQPSSAGASPLSDLSKEIELLVADALPMRASVAVGDKLVDAVLLDKNGHLLVPCVLTERTFEVTCGGEQVKATFVNADKLSDMTILKLAKVPAGATVAQVARQRPRTAELAVVLPPDGGAGRLVVWHGAPREKAMSDGLVIVTDDDAEGTRAAIAGFIISNEFRPLDLAQVVGSQLARGEPVQRARLGLLVGVVTKAPDAPSEDLPDRENIRPRTSLVVLRVLPGSAAEAAGAEQGDHVLALNGRPVANLAEFASILANTLQKATLSILRNGKPMDLAIKLDSDPQTRPDS